MNLKYYLRGFGIGIVVTAVIMGIASRGGKEELSNEEIKERAKALGMIEESTVLADAADSLQAELQKGQEETPAPTLEPVATVAPTPEMADAPSATPSKTSEPSIAPTPSKTSEPSAAPTPEGTAKPSAVPTPTSTIEPTPAPTPGGVTESAVPTEKPAEPDGGSQNAGTVTIEVVSGDGSLTVSRKLEQAGLVSSAFDFDLYLCQNGYDKRLNVGTFEIPANADYEQIARILAGLE